jgi:phosphate transport system substrate-binding protein
VLCGIYAGDITSWNNAKILALNPTVTALRTYNHTIVPVARDATSGTTYIFISFLATGATAAQHKCGYTTDWADTATSFSSLTGTISPADAVMSTRFSAMRAAKSPAADDIQSKTGNDGIRNYVSATSYSVGYVEMAYSFARNVKTAAIATASKYTSGKNKGKPNYLLPSVAGATNALEAQNKRYPGAAINPSASYLQPVNQAGLATYPIVGYSWMLLYRNYDTTITGAPTLGQVQGLVYFLNWALTTGSVSSVYTAGGVKCYAPLPTSVKNLVIAQLKLIHANGLTVWQ